MSSKAILQITLILLVAKMSQVLFGYEIAAISLTIGFSYMLWTQVSSMFQIRISAARDRAMSFGSSCLAEPAFPTGTKALPPVINILLVFERIPSLENVKERCVALLKYFRFRSKVVYNRKTGSWLFSPMDTSVNDHIITRNVSSEEEMLNIAHKISLEDPIDIDIKPAWMIYRLVNAGYGTSGILLRVHHVIGDGISLVSVMEALFTNADGTPFLFSLPERSNVPPNKYFGIGRILQLFISFFKVLTLGVTPYDTDTCFTSKNKKNLIMASSPKLVLFPTIRLEFLKLLKDTVGKGCTINDICLSATSGMLRRYMENKNDSSLKNHKIIQTRALVPVALPRSVKEMTDPDQTLKNKWVFVSIPMPVSTSNCLQRLQECTKFTSALKKSPIALMQMWVQNNIASRLPKFLQKQTVQDVFSRHSMVFSNVPGPQQPAYFHGHRLHGIQVLFPNVLSQLCLLSYDGGVFMNMIVDPSIVTDASLLPDLFVAELNDMAKSLNLKISEDKILAPLSLGKCLRLPNIDSK